MNVFVSLAIFVYLLNDAKKAIMILKQNLLTVTERTLDKKYCYT